MRDETEPMRLVVFGATGQVATELRRRHGDGVSVRALPRGEADLEDPAACAAIVRDCDANAVINAAAWTNVDGAEAEEDRATVVNAVTPGAMAAACAARGLPFLHISTDFVFDGESDAPLDEDAPVAPLSAYGRSKLAGETAVAGADPDAVIVRTTRVFAAHGTNWVRSMLRAAETRPALKVVDDQISGPTAAGDIADALIRIARARLRGAGQGGVFHFSAAPAVSMLDFTREIFRQADWAPQPSIEPSKTADWPMPARRPLRPVLDCRRIAAVFGVAQPDWRVSLGPVLSELKESRR
jgi:dTDP-4-dehydrorhamnose reductase